MELEDRIKALEDEMKILKNEIQSTLVDIQEQVLTHYYPALRAEEPFPSEEIKESLRSMPSERRRREPEPEETSAPPRARESSLEDIMKSLESLSEERTGTPKNVLTSPEGQPPSRSKEEIDPDTLMELAGWLSNSVERIGGERASRLIGGYAEKGRLAPDVKDILTGLIPFGDDENPPEKVRMTEMLDVVLQLNKILDLKSPSDIAMALSLIKKEENLG